MWYIEKCSDEIFFNCLLRLIVHNFLFLFCFWESVFIRLYIFYIFFDIRGFRFANVGSIFRERIIKTNKLQMNRRKHMY